MSGKQRWLIAGTYKISPFIDMMTLIYLSNYLFKERKCNDILEK
jgi:hypothetical protein